MHSRLIKRVNVDKSFSSQLIGALALNGIKPDPLKHVFSMTPTLNKNDILNGELEAYLKAVVQPIAHQIDTDSDALFESFRGLGRQGWLAPKNPTDFGGLDLTGTEYQLFQSIVARYSGALAFLQTQHQSAASLLLSSENEALKQKYLPGMAVGDICLGVGFSQLRRRPAPLSAMAEPPQKGIAVEGRYSLTGVFPWVTGAGLFTDFVGAAVLPDGTAVFGIVPLVSEQTGQLTVGLPMALAGMAATSTVEVRLEDWILKRRRWWECGLRGGLKDAIAPIRSAR